MERCDHKFDKNQNCQYCALNVGYLLFREELVSKRLRDKQRWVPVTEKLPEDAPKSVLAYSCRGMEVVCGDYVVDEYKYKFHDGITHWMPLPEPPQGDSE